MKHSFYQIAWLILAYSYCTKAAMYFSTSQQGQFPWRVSYQQKSITLHNQKTDQKLTTYFININGTTFTSCLSRTERLPLSFPASPHFFKATLANAIPFDTRLEALQLLNSWERNINPPAQIRPLNTFYNKCNTMYTRQVVKHTCPAFKQNNNILDKHESDRSK